MPNIHIVEICYTVRCAIVNFRHNTRDVAQEPHFDMSAMYLSRRESEEHTFN